MGSNYFMTDDFKFTTKLGHPKIFGICLVKNEADIIVQCLRAAQEWCTRIYVYDNGSEDGTWEKIGDFAATCKTIVPFRQDGKPFSDSLRGEVFEHFKETCCAADWWCRLDADEFYIDDPRAFLAEVPPEFDMVWSASFQYYFTEKDLARYQVNPELFADEVPAQIKCRYYLNNWSERRFFRHKRELQFRTGNAWPRPLRSPFPKRIRLKHFQYRSPHQIQKRLETRRIPMLFGLYRHEKVPDWQSRIGMGNPFAVIEGSVPDFRPSSWIERIADSSKLLFDDGQATYEIDEIKLPPIRGLHRGLDRWPMKTQQA
jgi:hypothetical protein